MQERESNETRSRDENHFGDVRRAASLGDSCGAGPEHGGAIQVTANSASDKASIDEIHMHLQHIARAFKSGEFNIPMFVHDQTPPGVPVMTRLKDQIKYRYEPTENGGRVVISSANTEAVTAIHEFLKFQITEHKTGDALEVK
jgi:hypothetical protein